MTPPFPLDPDLDLVLERIVDVPKELVWAAWTTPEHLKKWFCPRPWQTVECEIDLRPGGIFRTVMQDPEGKTMPPNIGCYLEVVENRRLTWTSALLPGFRPAAEFANTAGCGITAFTGMILIEDHGKGTRYTAVAIHRSLAEKKSHADMGFHDGWGTCLDQLVELVKTFPAQPRP